MQVLSVATARSVWLFDMNDLNPKGKSFIPDLITWLKERYKFQAVPSSPNDLDKDTKGLMFKAGEFQGDVERVNVNFGIYTDGLTADTWSSTHDSDLFLEDILRSVAREFGLSYWPEMIRSKRYVSELVVRLDPPLMKLNPQLGKLCAHLTEAFKRANLGQFEFTGVSFGTDNSQSSYKPPAFIIERKTDAPFSERRYYSKSPLTTDEHRTAIKEFESLLAD